MEPAETVFRDPQVLPADVWGRILEYRQTTSSPPSAASEPESTLTPSCPVCLDTGWVRRAVPITDPDFGKALECTACTLVAQWRAARLFKAAGLPPRLADVPPATDAELARYLPSGSARWLFLHGAPGVGKTWLAAALLRRVLADSQTAGVFITTPDLLDRIRQSFRPDSGASESELMAAVSDAPLLVLDDLGAERVTDWVEERLFRLVNHRYDYQRRTVITSNLTTEQLARHVGARTVWRICEVAEIVELTGRNRRIR